jgi:hypothetical protein
MAVPSSGALTMLGLAQEALYGTYGSGTITSPIYMYDLVNGGNSAGSGNSYPTINQGCTPNPADRTYRQLTNIVDANTTTPVFSLYYATSIGDASNLAVNDYLYTDTGLTTAAVSNTYGFYQASGSDPTVHCSTGYLSCFTDSTGKITSISCDDPSY